ncbi:hypothetical protein [Azospirillum sp. B2RO_4]|uniref:DUF7931 domain-containing protein n=1 Tax=Azospirillum sp. B2RO_4 TaxID=3027796 RepID=UPI003DA9CBD7
MDRYREQVQSYAEYGRSGRASLPVFNRSVGHAAIIIEILFRESEKEVDILTGCLNQDVYGKSEVISACRDFLIKGGRVRVLVERFEEFSINDHPMILGISDVAGQGCFDVRFVPEERQSLYTYHFAVSDGKSYRMEGDRTKTEAIAQFGDVQISGSLVERFNELWESSVSVPCMA